jgi:hypothetical protein
MIDVTTHKALRVSTEYPPSPSIEVADSQLDGLRRLLDRHNIRYWIDEHSISFNDGPFTTIVTLHRGTDIHAVQAILDSVD